MRILLVSGTTIGGSGRSQRELAARLEGLGNTVLLVADPGGGSRVSRWLYEQLSDLRARLGGRALGVVVERLERRPGRRPKEAQVDGVRHLLTPVPENALPGTLETFRPEVVVGNSIERLGWRKTTALCVPLGIPTVLYVREVEALVHFAGVGSAPADEVVANAASLARRIEDLGIRCTVFPSVIEVGRTLVDSSREAALVVNPIKSRGVELVWRLAERLPGIRFVLQESWPLSPDQLADVERRASTLPNVELRRAEPPGPRLYRDARVLVVPYRVDNRPRVIAEVQANGIPVVVGDSPALVEATGPGGVVVPMDDLDAWCRAIEDLWSDDAAYRRLSALAVRHSERDAISAADVAGRFEQFLVELVTRAGRAAS